MKKILLITLALVGLFSCKKPIEPKGEFTAVGSTQISYVGGIVKLHISSNVSWKIAAPQGVMVEPASGEAGEHEIAAMIEANELEKSVDYTLVATFTNPEGTSIKKELKLTLDAAIPGPEGSIEVVGDNSIDHNGGDINVKVTANCNWELSIEGATVNPSSGKAGEHTVVVTLPANNTNEEISYNLIASFSHSVEDSRSHISSITLRVGPVPAAPEATIEAVAGSDKIPFYGGQAQFSLSANCNWEIQAPEGIDVTPNSGVAGVELITVTVPANDTKEDITDIYYLTLTSEDGVTKQIEFKTEQEKACITYDGVDYKIVKLADGRIWMAENLRYVPAGFSASTSLENLNGFYAPLALKNGEAVLSTEDVDIAKNGLLYSAAIAFGLKDDSELTADNAASFEGKQGICPEGWHIPTTAEMIALVGKCSNKELTSTEAAYYDSTLDNGSIEKLNADGANFKAYGGVTVNNTAAVKGSLLKALNSTNDDFNTGYFLGSGLYQTQKNTDGTLKNIQYYSFMPNVNKGTMNVAYNGYRNGVSVRCIKNQ